MAAKKANGTKKAATAKAATATPAPAPARAKKPKAKSIDQIPVAERRGTVKIWDFDTWAGVAVHAPDMDALADAIEKSGAASKVQRDVTDAALGGTLAAPRGRYALLVKLKGHEWAFADVSGADDGWGWDGKLPQQFSRAAGAKVVWLGHEDCSGFSVFRLFDKGAVKIDFQSGGDGFGGDADDDGDDGDTVFKSATHPKDWWRRHGDEDQVVQALLREQGAYVPMFSVYETGGKLELEAFPEDSIDEGNVERVMLVALAGK